MVFFQGVEGQLKEILVLLADCFDESEVSEVQDFIDAGEYGLALETLVDIIFEENKRVPNEILIISKKVAQKMGLDELIIEKKLLLNCL